MNNYLETTFQSILRYFGCDEPATEDAWLNTFLCPCCGKESTSRDVHAGFRRYGWHCFVCGEGGGITDLSRRLDIESTAQARFPMPPRRHRPPAWTPPSAQWQTQALKQLEQYQRHPQKVELWQAYKPLSTQSIEQHGLGVGYLFANGPLWLVVPLYWQNQLVALRGRRTDESTWMSVKGSKMVPWGLESVQRGDTVVICENYVDGMWFLETDAQGRRITALGSVSNFGDYWIERLRQRRPKQAIVMLDNDLPGQATGELRKELEAEWCAKHNKSVCPILSNGVKIVRKLQAVGIDALLFIWPAYCPAKADLGWALGNGLLQPKGKEL